MPAWSSQPWQHDSNQPASAKPGTVHSDSYSAENSAFSYVSMLRTHSLMSQARYVCCQEEVMMWSTTIDGLFSMLFGFWAATTAFLTRLEPGPFRYSV
jgi:hypothetical protein